jgi:hypothetical protein
MKRVALLIAACCLAGCDPAHAPQTPPSTNDEVSIGDLVTLQVVTVRGHDYLVARGRVYGGNTVAVCPLVQEPRDSIFFRTDTTQAFDMAGNPIGN